MSKRQFRILMVLTVVSGLVGGGLSDWLFRGLPARAAQATTPPKVIEAQEFRLVDEEGSLLAFLGADEGLPILCFAGAENNPQVLIGVVEEGAPGVALADAEGQLRTVLGFDEATGETGLVLYDEAEHVRASFILGLDGNPELSILDIEEEPRALLTLAAGPDEGVYPVLSLWDNKGQMRAGLGLFEGQDPAMSFYDALGEYRLGLKLLDNGRPNIGLITPGQGMIGLGIRDDGMGLLLSESINQPRAMLGVADGQPVLILLDKAAEPRVGLRLNEAGEPSIDLLNATGRVIWEAP